MPYRRKSWKEKLEDEKGFPKILELKANYPCWRALKKMGASEGDSVVLAPGLDVSDFMKKVPEGKLQTLGMICEKIAEKYGVDYCCTLTTGIYINIAANAAEEMNEYMAYWRTIKNDGELNPKYPGGVKRQRKLLEKEGHKIIRKGKKHIKYYVDDYEKSLITTY